MEQIFIRNRYAESNQTPLEILCDRLEVKKNTRLKFYLAAAGRLEISL